MTDNIPQEIIDQFFEESGVKNLVTNDFGYTSSIAAHGDFLEYNGKELAVYRLAVLLSTLEGSYINDPDLGVNLIRYIYRPMTPENILNIKMELQAKINKYEKDLSLISITPIKDELNKTLYFELELKYLPTDEDITLQFDFVKDLQALIVRSM